MMLGLKRVPALILFVIVGCQFMLLPGQVNAWCCGYCQCISGCSCYSTKCKMAGPCRSDSDMFRVKPLADTDTLDGSSLAPLTVSVSKPTVTEGLTDLARGGECARKKFTLNLLSSAGDALEFEPIRFDEKNIQEFVAFKVTADQEK